MSKYTKAERHEIYKKALKVLNDKMYICYSINNIINRIAHSHDFNDFPEFRMFEPNGYKSGMPFGIYIDDCGYSAFGENGVKFRKTILEFCIYMTA